MKNETGNAPRVTLRIPGNWPGRKELAKRLPAGYSLGPEGLVLPDGTTVEFIPLPPDRDFPQVFECSCRRPPTNEERDAVAAYTVNIALSGAGGSLEAALAMMRAGAAIVRAGGAGVFIDNSAMAHGGADWLAMTHDGGPDAISFAFVSIVRDERNVTTMGMQVLGFPDLRMRSADVDEEGDTIIEIVRYICGGDRPVDVGHVLADERGPRFQVTASESDDFEAESPMHNPYGRLKIVSMKELAENS
jgi:hypothetical protein